jgi:hypothetical protein
VKVWSGRTSGHGASGLADLRVWLVSGMPLAQRMSEDSWAVLASTSDSPDAAGVPAGTSCERVDGAGLAAVVPPGYAVLVDGATPGRRLISAELVDSLRVAEPPDGTEAGFRAIPMPHHLRPVAEAATAAALAAGADRASAVFTTSGERDGLWVLLDGGGAQAEDAAFAKIELWAPREPVRISDARQLSPQARRRVLRGIAQDAQEGRPEGVQLSTRANVAIVLVCLVGAILIVAGRESPGSTGTLLQVAGWTVEALLIGAVLLAARAPEKFRSTSPLAALGFVVVVGGLLYQAVRG